MAVSSRLDRCASANTGLAAYDFYDQQLQEYDQMIETHYDNMPDVPPGDDTSPLLPRTQSRRKNQQHFDLTAALYRTIGIDLTEIDGIDFDGADRDR